MSLATSLSRSFILAGRPASGSEELAVTFPYDGSEIARVRLAGAADYELALEAAEAARHEVAALPPFRRAEILQACAALVAEQAEELARQITLETGNAIWETRLEVRRTGEILLAAAEEARRITGEIIPIDAWPNGVGRVAHTRLFPVGTVLAITPYNAPLLLVAHKLAAAFAAGCPCIVRPASKTPLSALSLGGLLVEAGAPPAAVSVLPSSNEVAEAVLGDERVRAISFTGSARVGWHIRRVAHTARVTLELGGNGAVIVHRDADVAHAAKRCAFGGYLRAGQACISVQRLYVHREILDDFRARLLDEMAKLNTGDPRDDDTMVGTLVSESAACAAVDTVAEAIAAGATVVVHGERHGAMLGLTLLEGVTEDMRVASSEVFAPVVGIIPYDDVDQAIRAADASPYGLQAGIFTNDLRIVHRAFEGIEVGGLIVNDVNTFRVDHMPYGGAKRSGTGREGVRYAIRDFSDERLLVVDPR